MANTPEGKVKDKVKKILKKYPHWGFWPVPSGFGKSSLDYVGCINGRFFTIETKVEGKKPTALQEIIIRDTQWAGGKVFVITGTKDEEQYRLLDAYLNYHYTGSHVDDRSKRSA